MYTHARIVIRAIQIVRSPAVSPAHAFAFVYDEEVARRFMIYRE